MKELDEESANPNPNHGTAGGITHSPLRNRAISSPQVYTDTPNESQPLIRRRSFEEYEAATEGSGPAVPVAGGTVLGIHNLAIVFPQFIVCVSFHLLMTLVLTLSPRSRLCPVLFSVRLMPIPTRIRRIIIHTWARMVLHGCFVSEAFAP